MSSLGFRQGNFRSFTAYADVRPNDLHVLSTVNHFDDESWSHIKEALLIENKWSLTQKQIHIAETYLLRAQLFYDKYKLIRPDPSAGLLAYYSALNLAKLLIHVNSPSNVLTLMSHGISFNPANQYKVSMGPGRLIPIFPELYKLTTNETLQTVSLKVFDLLCHSDEFTSQIMRIKLSPQVVSLKNAVALNKRNDSSWPLTRMTSDDASLLTANKGALRHFNKYFEKTKIPEKDIAKFFPDTRPTQVGYVYFQAVSEIKKSASLDFDKMVLLCEEYTLKASKVGSEVDLFSPLFDYKLHLPIRGKKIKINEFLALYALIFWASSVIRYDPSMRLVGDRHSQPRFLFDEIVRNAPYILLRHFVTLISKERVIYMSST